MSVIYTKQALKGLEETLTFMANDLHFPMGRLRVFKDEALDLIDSLAINPAKGHLDEMLGDLEEGHRKLVTGGHFHIIYKIVEGKVIITDFYDNRQPPSRLQG